MMNKLKGELIIRFRTLVKRKKTLHYFNSKVSPVEHRGSKNDLDRRKNKHIEDDPNTF